MTLVKERDADFGPTLAAEKLGELRELDISRETLRAWTVADGLWQTREKRPRTCAQSNVLAAGVCRSRPLANGVDITLPRSLTGASGQGGWRAW